MTTTWQQDSVKQMIDSNILCIIAFVYDFQEIYVFVCNWGTAVTCLTLSYIVSYVDSICMHVSVVSESWL